MLVLRGSHADLFRRDHLAVHPQRKSDVIAWIRAPAGESRLYGVVAIPQHAMGRLYCIRRDSFGGTACAGERDVFLIVIVVRIGIQDGPRRQFYETEGSGRDSLGRRHVALGQERRDAENIADVVEAIARIIDRKFFGRLEVDAEEVAYGVLVFDTIEVAGGDTAWIDRCQTVSFINSFADPVDHGSQTFGFRDSGRRHLPRGDATDNLVPLFALGGDEEAVSSAMLRPPEAVPGSWQAAHVLLRMGATAESKDALFGAGFCGHAGMLERSNILLRQPRSDKRACMDSLKICL